MVIFSVFNLQNIWISPATMKWRAPFICWLWKDEKATAIKSKRKHQHFHFNCVVRIMPIIGHVISQKIAIEIRDRYNKFLPAASSILMNVSWCSSGHQVSRIFCISCPESRVRPFTVSWGIICDVITYLHNLTRKKVKNKFQLGHNTWTFKFFGYICNLM